MSLLILTFLGVTRSGASVYYIIPNESDCWVAESECVTLSEFAASDTKNVSITLILLPGNHSLLMDLSVSDIKFLGIHSNVSNVQIKCESSSHISFESIKRVSISKLNFIGCGNNLVKNITEIFIQETTFKGQANTGTSLKLINTTAEIVDCTFVGNQFGTIMESVKFLRTLTSNIRWLRVRDVTGIVQVGGALISTHSNVSITNCIFESNSADIGGDIYANKGSNISIYNSTFIEDDLVCDCEEPAFGGAIFSDLNTILIIESQFRYKKATIGASLVSSSSNVTMYRSTFDFNSATDHAGGLFAYNSTVFIARCIFHNNTAWSGGGVATVEGKITVYLSVFTFNSVVHHGGALDLLSDIATISACYFKGNIANSKGGAVIFWSNTGKIYGKAMQNRNENCSDRYQGVVDMECVSDSTLGCKTQFISNSAPIGAALYITGSTVKSCGPIFISRNFATHSSSVYLVNSNWQFQGITELTQNLGSFSANKSNISFSGCVSFTDCSPPENATAYFKEGGALTLYQTSLTLHGMARFENNYAEIGGAIVAVESKVYLNNEVYVLNNGGSGSGGALNIYQTTLTLHGMARFVNNHAEFGGAIVARESEVYLNDEVHVLNNSASVTGGGLYLSQSQLISHLESNVTISNNYATESGGGLHAVSSLIKCIVSGSQYYTDPNGKQTEKCTGAIVYITENSAQKGGGIYLEAYSKIIIQNDCTFETIFKQSVMNFIGNSAQYGGAIYVDDATNSGMCASNRFMAKSSKSDSECFFSVVSIYNSTVNTTFSLNNILLYFDLNTATTSGATLFGGLLDRCIVSSFSDTSSNTQRTYEGDGLQYLVDILSEKNIELISSYPVQVCPCINYQQRCGYKINSYAEVKKGHFFTISVVAVDQVYKPVNATVEGRLRFPRSNLLYGQVTSIHDKCNEVSFRIISPHYSEELTLFASDGPCKDAGLSTLKVNVTFLPCTCPIGFTPSDEFSDSCSCICDPQISPYVTECNSTTWSFRRSENVWISYVNNTNTNSSGLLVHKYCPFDYCTLPNISGPVNLNQPEGSDAQCASNRTGMLCGACKPGLSLSLGSSKCLKCPRYWPVLFVSITVFSLLAGFGLVILLLLLNITVAVGTLNGLLFYANIVAANRVVLLPYPEPNWITVFISWLNLELGIDVCYIEGMDMYMRTWLQLAFPTYIILLVVLLITISRYSTRFSNLIAKRNPVATLATLILISYGKLFHVVLLAQPFSSTSLVYPDKTTNVVWLPDGTLKYFGRKHIVLFLAALLILCLCIIYSFLLLCWQLILHIFNWKTFKWIKIPTFNLFMEAYHVPYAAKHRYWTGLLLFARAIIYIIATTNVSGDPQKQLISIIFVLSCVILLKMLIATKIFKKWLIDSLESFFYFNIIFLASFTAYNLSTGNNQDGVAYTSVVLSMVVALFILLYHVYKYTSLFLRLRNTKFVTNIENRFSLKSKPKRSENIQPSTMNLICRHDDTIDILTGDADLYYTNCSHLLTKEQQPTESVVEIPDRNDLHND